MNTSSRTASKTPADKSTPDYWSDWLIDAVAGATQDRRYLRGDPAEDEVATAAIQGNGKKAMENLLSHQPACSPEILTALTNAAATIGAVYEWLDRIEQAGGATSMSGIASCHAMLKSLRKNGARTEQLIMAPTRAAIAKATGGTVTSGETAKSESVS